MAHERPAPVVHEIGFATDIGHHHHVNQDAGGAWTWIRADATPATLLVVADGVSAGRRSEDASRLAVETILAKLEPELSDTDKDLETLLGTLANAAQAANHAVAQRPHDSPRTADATTLAAMLCIGDEAAGIWCGDSRIYRVGGSIERLTRDHSWAEGVVSHGLMTAEQAAADPRAHMITRWLGPPDQDDPGLESFHTHLEPGDVALCCSDGLYMYFAAPYGEEEEIRSILASTDVQQGVENLITQALQRGGHDNITASVVRVLCQST